MRRFVAFLALVMIVPAFLFGCTSIVATGQTREAMVDTGALRWTVTEYDFGGSRFVWIPHWVEGCLHVSTPHASNVKKLDVLEFKDDLLVSVTELGEDRDKWAAMLKTHWRIAPPTADSVESDWLHIAATERIVHIGASTECVLFACGFPSHGPSSNPRVKRTPYEIKRDDTLYYVTSRGGRAMEIELKDGRVTDVHDAEHASKFWSGFYTR